MTNNNYLGCGVVLLVLVILVIGGGFLYQREGGKLFGPDGVIHQQIAWKPGSAHPSKPNVIASNTENSYLPAPGYKWVDFEKNDMEVVWTKEIPHPLSSNVISSEKEKIWLAAPGYLFSNRKIFVRDDQVQEYVTNYPPKWEPGMPHPFKENVISADTEGAWKVAEGFIWVKGTKSLETKPQPVFAELSVRYDTGTFSHDLVIKNDSNRYYGETHIKIELYKNDSTYIIYNRSHNSWPRGESKKINVSSYKYIKQVISGIAEYDSEQHKVISTTLNTWK